MFFRVYFKDGTRIDVEASSPALVLDHYYNFKNKQYHEIAKWPGTNYFKLLPKRDNWKLIKERQ